MHAEVSNGIYSVFYTFGLLLRIGLPCGPLLDASICMGFCVSRSEQHGIYGSFCVFSRRHFFRAGPILLFLQYYLHLFTAPAHCVYLCLCASRAEKHDFTVSWLRLRRQFFQHVFCAPLPLFHVPCRHVTLTVWGGMPVRRLVSTPSLVFRT